MNRAATLFSLLVLASTLVSSCQPRPAQAGPAAPRAEPVEVEPVEPVAAQAGAALPEDLVTPEPAVLVEFSLQTALLDGRMVYVGAGGEIDGAVNPDLVVAPGDTVHVILVNGDGMPHDFSAPDFAAATALVGAKGKTVEVTFTVGVDEAGTYAYYCTQPGHRQAGQEGKLVVSQP